MPPFHRQLRRSMFAAIFCAAAGGLCAAPSLVVVVSLDQFRYDYLERFRPYFGPGGFNLLLEQGASYTDCRYRHSVTKTGPGHADRGARQPAWHHQQ